MAESDEPSIDDEIASLREAPVELVLGGHILGLLRLAAVHLAATPPELEPARLAIDVVAAVVAAGGERLGEHAELYRRALAEAQQVYVRASAPPTGG